MVNQSNFAKVREAFAVNVGESLRRLGVQVKAQNAKDDWLQIACPLCPDKSGSASVSIKSGFLRCHQCGGKADLFGWVGQHIGKSKPWDVCQEIAGMLGIEVEGRKGKLYKRVPSIDNDVMLDLKHRLFADGDCEGARSFLASRKLWDPVLLEAMPIGALGEQIVFFQHDNAGRVKPRAKVYNPRPSSGRSKWTYSDSKTASGRSVGFWPYLGDPEEGAMILLCEGEWDVLSAIFRMQLMRKGMHVQCWTGGGGAPIPFDALPESFRDREVHIIYDNDTFQGLSGDRAPDVKKATEMRLRKKNLVDNVAEAFVANRCSVFLRQVTIDPLKSWGADLRDMIDGGLETFNEVPVFPLADCRRAMVQAKKIEFSQVHDHVGQYVEFNCQVAAINDDVLLVPARTHILCAMGTKKMCDNCQVPVIASNAVLEWAGKENQLVAALTTPNPVRHIYDNVLGKPTACKPCEISHLDTRPGARWAAMSCEGDDDPGRAIEVISGANPPLSGEIKIRGWVYTAANSVTPILMCDHLEAMDRVVIDIVPHKADLFLTIPHGDNVTVEDIDNYLDEWHRDISNNTTHIYGRRDMHVVAGLVMHSALWLDVLGAKRRGWLDACIIGATRTGKSAALRAYLQNIGLGQHHTPMGNYSRAGLTLGTVTINNTQKVKPGIWPRNHGKLLVTDESHLMVQDNIAGGGLFPMLQGARDVGKVESAKVSGSQMLPAAVRLIAVSNWIKGGRNSFGTPVEHLLALYGTPESLSRLDFAIPVHEINKGTSAEEVPHFWTRERQRVVATRAWNLRPEDVEFDDDAIALARQFTEHTWKDRYSEEMPLYTEKEKVFSVLRIGTAIANMMLSHRNNDISKTFVRTVHIEWAAKWLEHTWKLLDYDAFSNIAMTRLTPKQVWKIESKLTAGLGLADVTSVRYVLGRLFGILTREEMRSIVGKTPQEFEPWANEMIRLGAIEVVKGYTGFSIGYRLSRSAIDILQRLLMIADEFPESWASRYNVLFRVSTASGPMFKAPEDALPIDSPIDLFRYDLRNRSNFDEDQDAG